MNPTLLSRKAVTIAAASPRGLGGLISHLCILVILCLATTVFAQDKKESPNPAGTWKWTVTPPNGEAFVATLKLKMDGDKLTGTMTGRGGNEMAIEDAKLSGDEISFKVVRERDGQKFVSNHKGKLSGDSIKGKIESDFNGQKRERDWDAKREGAKASTASIAGTWKWTFTTQNGDTINASMKLKLEDGKLSGTVAGRNGNEVPIEDAKLEGDQITFKAVRERDGQKFVSNYNGKFSGDSIKGKIESDINGQKREREWDAKRDAAK